MRNMFVTRAEAADIARSGVVALVAGSEASVATLSAGRWIRGTTNDVVIRHGGVVDAGRVFRSIIDEAVDARFAVMRPDTFRRRDVRICTLSLHARRNQLHSRQPDARPPVDRTRGFPRAAGPRPRQAP